MIFIYIGKPNFGNMLLVLFDKGAIPTKGQPKSEKMKMHLQAPYALFLLGNISNFIISNSFS